MKHKRMIENMVFGKCKKKLPPNKRRNSVYVYKAYG